MPAHHDRMSLARQCLWGVLKKKTSEGVQAINRQQARQQPCRGLLALLPGAGKLVSILRDDLREQRRAAWGEQKTSVTAVARDALKPSIGPPSSQVAIDRCRVQIERRGQVLRATGRIGQQPAQQTRVGRLLHPAASLTHGTPRSLAS